MCCATNKGLLKYAGPYLLLYDVRVYQTIVLTSAADVAARIRASSPCCLPRVAIPIAVAVASFSMILLAS